MQTQFALNKKSDMVFAVLISAYGAAAHPARLRGPWCCHPTVHYRHEAAWLMRRAYKHWSLPMIGKILCRHHTSILSGIASVERRRERDAALRQRLDVMLGNLLNGNGNMTKENQLLLVMSRV